MGAVEEYFGESTGTMVRGTTTLLGFVGDIYADPNEQPLLSEVSKSFMYGGSHVEGYKFGKNKTREYLDKKQKADDADRRVREGQRTESLIAELKASMEKPSVPDDEDSSPDAIERRANGRAHDTQ